ncbi:hypothetical protein AGLY_004865 [Aphis glycines]|uniref:Uncharacterized protein n=1 Tax=Aphis glycines TaxID=307491 RepID=A0A6G0TXI1_APHGL|nr:hypothetical protein AGLY_004865 [Aphis glycines]
MSFNQNMPGTKVLSYNSPGRNVHGLVFLTGTKHPFTVVFGGKWLRPYTPYDKFLLFENSTQTSCSQLLMIIYCLIKLQPSNIISVIIYLQININEYNYLHNYINLKKDRNDKVREEYVYMYMIIGIKTFLSCCQKNKTITITKLKLIDIAGLNMIISITWSIHRTFNFYRHRTSQLLFNEVSGLVWLLGGFITYPSLHLDIFSLMGEAFFGSVTALTAASSGAAFENLMINFGVLSLASIT